LADSRASSASIIADVRYLPDWISVLIPIVGLPFPQICRENRMKKMKKTSGFGFAAG
jgi:hypothetical protein